MTVGLIIVVIGALIFSFGVVKSGSGKSLMNKGIAVKGKVIDEGRDGDPSSLGTYKPTVRYSVNGRIICSQQKIPMTRNVPSIGDEVTLVYKPSDPEEFILSNCTDRAKSGSILIGFGTLALLSGAIMTVAAVL